MLSNVFKISVTSLSNDASQIIVKAMGLFLKHKDPATNSVRAKLLQSCPTLLTP